MSTGPARAFCSGLSSSMVTPAMRRPGFEAQPALKKRKRSFSLKPQKGPKAKLQKSGVCRTSPQKVPNKPPKSLCLQLLAAFCGGPSLALVSRHSRGRRTKEVRTLGIEAWGFKVQGLGPLGLSSDRNLSLVVLANTKHAEVSCCPIWVLVFWSSQVSHARVCDMLPLCPASVASASGLKVTRMCC